MIFSAYENNSKAQKREEERAVKEKYDFKVWNNEAAPHEILVERDEPAHERGWLVNIAERMVQEN